MSLYLLKTLVSAVLIVAVSELGKFNSVAGALLASLPITSLLAFIWLYWDTGSTERIAELSQNIFWLVLPSLILFLVLPLLLRLGFGFWAALSIAMSLTAGVYLLGIKLLTYLRVIQ
jgi:hypothetical protein